MTTPDAATERASASSELIHDTYDVAGQLIDVATPRGDVHRTIRRVFGGFGPVAADATERPRYEMRSMDGSRWQVLARGTAVRTGATLLESLAALEWSIMTAAIANRHDRFHLHGAALRIPGQDAAIAITGASGAGKTTLVMALVAAGFEPYADDVMLIDPDTLQVEPCKRAFHVHDDTWRLIAGSGQPLSPDPLFPAGYYLPERWAHQSAPIRWLITLAHHVSGAPAARRIAPAEAAPVIVRETLSLAPTPRLALNVTSRLTAAAACYALTPGSPTATVALVETIIADGLVGPS